MITCSNVQGISDDTQNIKRDLNSLQYSMEKIEDNQETCKCANFND